MNIAITYLLMLTLLIGAQEPVRPTAVTGRLINYETKEPMADFKGICNTNSLDAFGTGKELGWYHTDSGGHFSFDVYLTRPDVILRFLFDAGASVTVSHGEGPLIDLGDVPLIRYDNELEILQWDSSYACTSIPDGFHGRAIETVVRELGSTDYVPTVDTLALGQAEKGHDAPQCLYRYKVLSVHRDLSGVKG